MLKPNKQLVKYYGSKWNIASWIIAQFPRHETFVDVFGGSGSVLISKQRSDLEVFNDLSDNVVNFFRVLRDHTDELHRRLRLTPYARSEFELCRQPCVEDPIESARRFVVSSRMTISNRPHDPSSGMRISKTSDRDAAREFRDLFESDLLHRTAHRFMGVQIEQSTALELIEKYDAADVLFYCDPPYVLDTRSYKSGYEFEWSNEQHVEFLERLNNLQGMVVLSGYDHPIYRHLADLGWKELTRETLTQRGTRTEFLWVSPNAAHHGQQLLF